MPTASPFQIGDTVQLKLGGPKMTVVEISTPATPAQKLHIWAGWFADVKSEKASFRAEP